MRPLTVQRLLLQCSILAVILFAVVVVALKLGAVPVSLYGLGRDLIHVLLRQTSQLSSGYGMIVIEIRLPIPTFSASPAAPPSEPSSLSSQSRTSRYPSG